MRQTFDSDVPIADQIMRIVKCHTGRKHMHKRSTRIRTKDGTRKARRRAAVLRAHPLWR